MVDKMPGPAAQTVSSIPGKCQQIRRRIPVNEVVPVAGLHGFDRTRPALSILLVFSLNQWPNRGRHLLNAFVRNVHYRR